MRDVLLGTDVDHPERASRDTVATAVANRLIDVDRVELGTDNRPRRADLEARRIDAVLAHVRHHQPPRLAPIGAELLDKLDVPPVDVRKRHRVIVAQAGKRHCAPVPCRQCVPLVASHLARLAANADGRIRVKADRLCHASVSLYDTPRATLVK